MKSIYTFLVLAILLMSSCTDTLIGDEGEFEEDIFLDYQTKTDLELPFEDEWFVVWGGKSIFQNKHFNNRNERYAMDVLQVVDGSSFTGDGTKNEDYYCFGKRLNAPSDGKIVALKNNIEDNIPGVLNKDESNYVIIDHLNGEFSVLLHLKKGSIIVAVGDTVVKGQEIGKVGNSGNSTQPHLHYQLATSNSLDGNGIGLPIQFLNYYEDNVLVERGEPIRGQIVRKN